MPQTSAIRVTENIVLPNETYIWIGKGFLQEGSKEIFSNNLNIDYIEILIYPNDISNQDYIDRMNEFANSVNPNSKIVLQLCYFLGGNNSHARRDYNIYDYIFNDEFKSEFNEMLIGFFDKLTFKPDYFRLGSFDCDSWGCTGWDLSNRTNIIYDDYVFPYSVRRNFSYMGEDIYFQFRSMNEQQRDNRISNLYDWAIVGMNEYSDYVKSYYPDSKFIWTIQAFREYYRVEWSPYEKLARLDNLDILMSLDYARIYHNLETAKYLEKYAPENARTLVCMNGGVWGNRHYYRGDHSPEYCIERYPEVAYMHCNIVGMTMIDAGDHKALEGDDSIYLWQSMGRTTWNTILWDEMLITFARIKSRDKPYCDMECLIDYSNFHE